MKVVITAGGTGGHIYPAIAIINKIKELEKDSEFIYFGTHNRMEKDIIPNLGIKYIPLEIYGLSKNIPKNIKNLLLINKAYKKSLNIISSFKPDVVIGVGGYVTYPVIKAAHKLKIKTFIHEQNSIPGKSNRMLMKYVDIVGVSFKDSIKYFKDTNKVRFTGNPCSENAINAKKEDIKKYNLPNNKKLILMVQGSLGSSSINNLMKDFLNKEHDYEIIYITGKNLYDNFKENTFQKNVHIMPYIDNLSGFMKNVDVIISRAGASVLSEILALKIPSIIIPSPYVANNHQYYNALSLKNNNACIMIEEDNINVKNIEDAINKCLDKETRMIMKKNMEKLSIVDSSTKIYEVLKELTK